jgi:hypothetical protein
MRRLLACLALAVLAGPAAACLNDNELPTHEREFRSHYRGPASPPSTDAEPSGRPLLFGAGGVLLIGAFALGSTGRRARA